MGDHFSKRQGGAISEADLCSSFVAAATKHRRDEPQWVAYPETAGFDILLVRASDGVQVGIEAKLALNPRVVAQVLPPRMSWYGDHEGPDYRAVLVPAGKCNSDVRAICDALGITVIEHHGGPGEGYYDKWARGPEFSPALPVESYWRHDMQLWHEWLPQKRCALPDYVPDVAAGVPAPVSLTAWKVKAIKLLILAGERPVTRADFKHLQLSPTSWLCPGGWLDRRSSNAGSPPAAPDELRANRGGQAEVGACFS
ncbi:hypothetical protein FF100_04645 [Methylobacterium terricola]|uniref:Uncharacterized protein n=1 Tax=Methylobacterium terricola TaxID=2583531 RepID=A0A5C4LN49_9HYPH|nr:hypothetical protein [Methylobacterium terricola]TNC14871.1 hypothetical protein FF100_04645 [Methylobacterium terricola]